MFVNTVFVFALLKCLSCYKLDYLAYNETDDAILKDVQVQPRVINRGSPPNHFDWRDKDYVSPVKDMGSCAACWAFSVVANVESHISIHVGDKILLSEQFLIDCLPGSPGCGPYSLINTYSKIVSELGGVLANDDYYEYSQNQHKCQWNGKPKPMPVIGFKRVQNDARSMVEALFRHGPLSSAINSASMKKYQSGDHYIDEPSDTDCSPKKLDHAVLIVGYNVYVNRHTGQKTPYWIIKNSWGNHFGDKGYYYLVRGRNACGIESDVTFAMVK